MSYQSDVYLSGLGDDWYERNKEDLGKKIDDPVSMLLSRMEKGTINSILEVGCSSGWRLKRLSEEGFQVAGIDPSAKAIEEAKNIGPDFYHGTASMLPWPSGHFDCVVMGFCMWAIDPSEWLAVVGESDRVLKDKGFLIIHDRFTSRPIRRVYPDRDDIFGYAYDWKKLWLAHPAYREVAEAMGVYHGTLTIEGACLLYKDIDEKMLTVKEPEEK